MPATTNPELLITPLAKNAEKNVIPETTGATTGLFSQDLGFQEINSTPLTAGGKAPDRKDFNGVFNLLGGVSFYAQKGWTFHYDATQEYYLGCLVIDPADGKRYECIADMPAGTIAPHSDTGNTYWRRFTLGDGAHVGDIKAIAYNGEVQAGWLLCDGSAVSRTMYPDLFAVIGTTYGAGDGSTTFNVPDYNTAQRFAQGGTVAGVEKEAGLPNIEGALSPGYYYGTDSTNFQEAAIGGTSTGALEPAFGASTRRYVSSTANGPSAPTGIQIDASLSNPIYGNSDTVQPNALTTRYIIKAFDGQTADSALIDITQYAEAVADARVPIGMMLPCATETACKNFLLCDGSAVSRDTYSALFAVIGTKYGAGDGSTTFNLPDYNVSGRFVQGGTVAGTVKAAGLPNITGNLTAGSGLSSLYTGAFRWTANNNAYYPGSEYLSRISFDASRSSSVYGNSDTVQPPALTACWQIKYC